jgi:hypothetical protein
MVPMLVLAVLGLARMCDIVASQKWRWLLLLVICNAAALMFPPLRGPALVGAWTVILIRVLGFCHPD